MSRPSHGTLHHVELWVPNLHRAHASLGWLLEALGYDVAQSWASGCSWQLGPTYLVIEQSSALTADEHDRCRPGRTTWPSTSKTPRRSRSCWPMPPSTAGT